MIWKMENRRMGIVIREYQTEDVTAAITIWNQVVEDGVAFPQEEGLTGKGKI